MDGLGALLLVDYLVVEIMWNGEEQNTSDRSFFLTI